MLANTRTVDPLELNSIKEKFSIAYIHGLNAYMNYAIDFPNKDMDGLGIDCIIADKVVGPGRKVASESHSIFLQLKATSLSSNSVVSEDDISIHYKLSNSLNPMGTHYLVVVVLQKEEELEEWLEVKEKELILRSRAYYLLVSELLNAGIVTIPKTNTLNFKTFPTLFDAAKLKADNA